MMIKKISREMRWIRRDLETLITSKKGVEEWLIVQKYIVRRALSLNLAQKRAGLLWSGPAFKSWNKTLVCSQPSQEADMELVLRAIQRFNGLFLHPYVENIGFEPMTSCMPCKRSSQLS